MLYVKLYLDVQDFFERIHHEMHVSEFPISFLSSQVHDSKIIFHQKAIGSSFGCHQTIPKCDVSGKDIRTYGQIITVLALEHNTFFNFRQ